MKQHLKIRFSECSMGGALWKMRRSRYCRASEIGVTPMHASLHSLSLRLSLLPGPILGTEPVPNRICVLQRARGRCRKSSSPVLFSTLSLSPTRSTLLMPDSLNLIGGETVFPSAKVYTNGDVPTPDRFGMPECSQVLPTYRTPRYYFLYPPDIGVLSIPTCWGCFKKDGWFHILCLPLCVCCRDIQGLQVAPEKGAAALFYSQLGNGQRDYLSLHGGCPPEKGVKWGGNLFSWNMPVEEVTEIVFV